MVLTAVIMAAASISLASKLIKGGDRLIISLEGVPVDLKWIIMLLDFALLIYIAYIGIKLKKPLITVLSVLQLLPMAAFELLGGVEEPSVAFVADSLSIILVLIASIIGGLISIFALGYMKEHEHHQHLEVTKQPRFFMLIFLFLGAMNALVLCNNLLWVYFFWEVTTFCSFLLISHDGNETAVNNASKALWINLAGGVAFTVAIIMLYNKLGTLSIDEMLHKGIGGGFTGIIPTAVALLCFAGFTKSAQFPFQSWLLGAMVAPTPVSSLLHSSTMVKAGVYLIVRFAPMMDGTVLGQVVAAIGGFTFMAGSAIAISQRNSKRVLAYSTIANLGLIICCAGIGTHIAIGAAILLIIFHAVSKSLLFLCVGTVEQGIGSRDIEDMQGLMKKMPYTTVIMVVGMISMLLPPFGVLLTKWLAIEAAVELPFVLILLVLGSAFTVVFWAKWISITLTMSYKQKLRGEKLPISMRSVLGIILLIVLAVSICITPVFNTFVAPQIAADDLKDGFALTGNGGGVWLNSESGLDMGGFSSLPLFLIVFILMILIPFFMNRSRPEMVKPPYAGGELANDDIRGIEFTGPMDKLENIVVHNYYLSGVFGESRLTLWMNLIAGAIILIMFGVVV